MPSVRQATHAGSWYSENPKTLSKQLDDWLDQVPDTIEDKAIPQPKARVIIAPHAGYAYSGPTAAWAYKSVDVSKAKRVFLLGPAHHVPFKKCALSKFDYYSTPLGDIKLDKDLIDELHNTGEFESMNAETDQDEHSLELHLPYIHKILPEATLIPILVGNTSRKTEIDFGKILASYLKDPSNIFVVSSDFAHWGRRFSYTRYVSDPSDMSSIRSLSTHDRNVQHPKIYESIAAIDQHAMDAIGTGKHDNFLASLNQTGNTVCGRHPIGIIMAAMEELVDSQAIKNTTFQFVKYARSSDPVMVSDSSVSYVSAYAIIESA